MQGLLERDKIVFSPPALGTTLFLSGLPGRGDKIYDRSPYGHLGTIVGAAWRRLPSGLWYLDFDGVDDYLKFDVAVPAFLPTTALSVGLWMKNDTSEASTRIISMSGADNRKGWFLKAATNTAVFSIHNNLAYVNSTSTSLTIREWHFVAAVYNKIDLRVYAEGVLASTPTAETANIAYTASAALHIGVREGLTAGEFFDGGIALPRVIRGYAWSATEIQNSFNQEKHLFGVL